MNATFANSYNYQNSLVTIYGNSNGYEWVVKHCGDAVRGGVVYQSYMAAQRDAFDLAFDWANGAIEQHCIMTVN